MQEKRIVSNKNNNDQNISKQRNESTSKKVKQIKIFMLKNYFGEPKILFNIAFYNKILNILYIKTVLCIFSSNKIILQTSIRYKQEKL